MPKLISDTLYIMQSLLNKLWRSPRIYLEVTPFYILWMGKNQRRVFYKLLRNVSKKKIPGAILEIGTARGFTSAFIAKIKDYYDPEREFHVYDSFQGMSASAPEDGSNNMLKEGDLCIRKEQYKFTYRKMTNFELPIIHEGWIENTLPGELPEQIAFAYIDVDFYKPTLHALRSIYPRLSKGAVVIIDDYIHPRIPGVRKAVDEFMKDKPEILINIPPGEDFADDKNQAYFIKAQSH